MTVRLRRDGRKTGKWQADFTYRSPDGTMKRCKQAAKGARNRGEALAWEAVRRRELESAAHSPAKPPPTLAEFAPEFMRSMAASNKPSEVGSKADILRIHLIPTMGELRLDHINARGIETAKAEWISAGAKPNTVNNRLTCLRKALSVALEWGLISVMPAIRRCRTEEPEVDFLTAAESTRLLAAANGMWRVMILVALRTGLRRGELMALRWQDVNLVDGALNVRRSITRGIETDPKGRRAREVPLSPETVAALRAYYTAGPFPSLVFCGSTGAPLTPGEMAWALYTACDRACQRRRGWHVLRHSFASQLVMAGVTLKAVQELLGHRDIKITLRYAHLAPGVVRNAVALLDGKDGV